MVQGDYRRLFWHRGTARWLDVNALVLLSEMPEIAAWLETMLQGARTEILLENYIFQEGRWPGRILDILCDRARAGVHVHLRLDALGSRLFPARWIARLEEAGGTFEWYHRLAWRGWEKRLRRTHRRLLAIDGTWLAVGGYAFADSWLSGVPGGRPYRDILLACSGPVAELGRELFYRQFPGTLWPLGEEAAPPVASAPLPDPVWGPVRLLAGTPPRQQAIRRRYLAAFRSARESIWVASPYFSPDRRLLSLLYAAARRGVDVRVLLAGRVTDHPLLRLGIQAYYQNLLRHGVRVYEYEGSFLHGKYVLVDGRWASTGSANLDFLSLWFNRELNLELRGAAPTGLFRTLFLREFAQAREVFLERWEKRSLGQRLLEWLMARVDRQIQARALGARRY